MGRGVGPPNARHRARKPALGLGAAGKAILQALAAFQEATGLSRRLRYARMEAYAPLGLGFYHRFRNEYGPVLAYTQQARQRAGTLPGGGNSGGWRGLFGGQNDFQARPADESRGAVGTFGLSVGAVAAGRAQKVALGFRLRFSSFVQARAMAAFASRRALKPLIHVLVWGLFGLTLLLFHPLTGRIIMPPQFWVKQGVMLAIWVAAFYLTAQASVPRLLLRGHTSWFAGALVATAAAVLLINYGLEKQLHLRELMDNAFHAAARSAGQGPGPRGGSGGSLGSRRSYRFDAIGTLITLLVLGISTSITVVGRWQDEAQGRAELEQQRIGSELASLKAQINPHFFFNTLNNIYALTLLDGEQARVAIHRLSRMMRYVLYETAAGPTLLSQEVAFVQDYITLMQLRFTDRVMVAFAPPAPLLDVPLAPMLLLPFVENAFKHGVAASHTSRIAVALCQPTPETLVLEVRNTRLSVPTTDLAGSNGIGLANTRRRLDLLYPGRYRLLVTERTPENEYLVELTLTVNS